MCLRGTVLDCRPVYREGEMAGSGRIVVSIGGRYLCAYGS